MLKPISGTWFEFRHHNPAEGRYWNEALQGFSSEQWKEKIEEIASLGMEYIVLMASALKDEDREECYFETDIFPFADMKCTAPMDVLFEACEKFGIKVFVSCGFYGVWTDTLNNMTSEAVTERAFKAMEVLYKKYGKYKSFYGWYYPDETCINEYFDERFISYVNRYSEYVHKLAPDTKTLIAPYGTQLAKADGKFIEQLKRLDVDIIAYQDEVGVQKAAPNETKKSYERLSEAHAKAGRAAIWADMEIFEFEGEVYNSALIPAAFERIQKQLDSVSPYVDTILCYQYQGMINKPETPAYCGAEGSAELYRRIRALNAEAYGI
ncbi:MAG: DUF4434 domain-containing protein [Clostridia bacterium]|nr:DUF4434 domain-containing protein [Clostridia bacterium]